MVKDVEIEQFDTTFPKHMFSKDLKRFINKCFKETKNYDEFYGEFYNVLWIKTHIMENFNIYIKNRTFWRLEGFSKRKDVEIKQLDTVFPKHMFIDSEK